MLFIALWQYYNELSSLKWDSVGQQPKHRWLGLLPQVSQGCHQNVGWTEQGSSFKPMGLLGVFMSSQTADWRGGRGGYAQVLGTHGPFQHGQKERESLREADITVLRNATIEGLYCMILVSPQSHPYSGEGNTWRCGWKSGVGITGIILESALHAKTWFGKNSPKGSVPKTTRTEPRTAGLCYGC